MILDDVFVRDLHHRMFGDVWKWAGKYRTTDKNIGVDPREVPVAVRNLCEDAKVWCAAAAIDAQRDAAAVEVHHRLALIHPFVNGNGRHARLMADLLVVAMGGTAFSWGGTAAAMPTADGDRVRADYLDALRKADRGDLPPLVSFARS
jgi:Fic-DOC domain mobile mystery protein B